MPALVIPQILLCGLFVPRDELPDVLEAISNVLPLSYAVDAMQTVTAVDRRRREVWARPRGRGGFAVGGLALGAADPAPPYALTRDGRHAPEAVGAPTWSDVSCSASRCCCSPAASRSRSSSARCRSRRGSCTSYVPGETTEPAVDATARAGRRRAARSTLDFLGEDTTRRRRRPTRPSRPTSTLLEAARRRAA